MTRSVLVIAGEISGDQRAAELIRAAQAHAPDLHFWGIGGDELRAAGMEILYDTHAMAVMGLGEVLRRYGFFRRVFADLVARARERRPDAVLLVDYPGFNLRFAAEMRKLGIKVLYYICPQVWAWHRARIPHMARLVNRLMAIFPFEPEVFVGTGGAGPNAALAGRRPHRPAARQPPAGGGPHPPGAVGRRRAARTDRARLRLPDRRAVP